MNSTPSTPALAFLKQQGIIPTLNVSEAQAQVRTLLSRAAATAALATQAGADDRAKLLAANDVTSICAATVYACHGLGTLPDSASQSVEAISLLKAELNLSDLTTMPLTQLRQELRAADNTPACPFLAYQCSLLCNSLVDWTADFASEAFA